MMSDAGSVPGLTFGRSSPDVLPSRDQFAVEINGENGSPLWWDTAELISQPLRIALVAGAGVSHVAFAAKACRMWKGAGAQSAFESYGFCAYTDVFTESTFSCATVLSMVLLSV